MKKIRIAQIGTGHPHSTGAAQTILENPEMECVGFAKVTPDYIHPEHGETPDTDAPGNVTAADKNPPFAHFIRQRTGQKSCHRGCHRRS